MWSPERLAIGGFGRGTVDTTRGHKEETSLGSDFHGVVSFTDRGREGPVNGTGNRAGNDRATEPWVGHFPGSVCQGDLRNERVARRERCSR